MDAILTGFPGIETAMMSDQDKQALLDGQTAAGPGVILEYGSGGSTCFFADALHVDQTLISVEHNSEWFSKLRDALKDHPKTAQIKRILAPLAFPHSLWQFARPEEEMAAGAKKYIWAPVLVDPTFNWNTVSMAFVDGIARGPCLALLRLVLPPGTYVFLHDYKGREDWYDWAVNLYDRVDQYDLTIKMRVPLEPSVPISAEKRDAGVD